MRPSILWLIAPPLLLLLVAGLQPAQAAAFIRVGNGTAASCTENALRHALTVAETLGGGVISFKCGRKPVTILLAATLTVPNNTTINGGGLITLELPFDFVSVVPVIDVDQATTVILTDVSLEGSWRSVHNEGTLIVRKSTFSGWVAGGIRSSGTLIVDNSTFCCAGTAVPGGAIANSGSLIVNNSAFFDLFATGISNGGTAAVNDSEFVNNEWDGFGGGIDNSGTLTVRNSTFSGNTVIHGGAIFNVGSLTIHGSTFTDNHASSGGAITNEGVLTVNNSTFRGNSAGVFGGAIYNEGALVVRNSRITENSADAGGGIYTCCGGTATLTRTSVTGNTPDDIFP